MFDKCLTILYFCCLSNICQTFVKQNATKMNFQACYNYKKKELDHNEKYEVKIECYFNRRYRYIGTGVFIEPRYWDEQKKAVTSKYPSAKVVNILLSEKINELNVASYECERMGGVFDFAALDDFTGGGGVVLFSKFIQNEMLSETLEMKSIQKYKRNIDILCNLLPDMPIDKIKPSHIAAFDAKLRGLYQNSTCARINIFVSKYFKRAVKNGLIAFNPYDRASISGDRGQSKAVFLAISELQAIEQMQCLNETIELVRDRFLYSCYTGLRISDNMALKKDMVKETDAGLVVSLHTIKGYGHDLVHPLRLMFNAKPEAIVKKWIDKHDSAFVFPVQSDQHINNNLKTIAAICNISKNITFHTARHTCATMLAEVTQNPFLMLNIMGWSDVRIAMNYIHRSTENTIRQLKVYDDKWI